jgi:hypothetical protein
MLSHGATTAAVMGPDGTGVPSALPPSDRPRLHVGPVDDARFPPGHIFASRYRIVSLLGRGAMGEVYRADDLRLGKVVAVKLLATHAAPSRDLQRFISEVRLARDITHPNVCRVYDIGEADGWHYLSMEYVDGETLASLLRRIGRMPRERRSTSPGSSVPASQQRTMSACSTATSSRRTSCLMAAVVFD